MLAAYKDVGNDFNVDQGRLVKGFEALRGFESVPRRWPLARLTVPLLNCVDHIDRVLAGCCWEVLITRQDPDDSVGALRQAARSLTLTVACYLSEFVAETLRSSQTSQGAPWQMRSIFTSLEPILASTHISGVAACGLWAQCQCSDRAVGLSKLWLNKGGPMLWIKRVSRIGSEASVQPTP